MAIQMEVAPPKDRFVAAAIDFVPPFVLFVALAAAGLSGPAMILALLSSLYFVFRDLIGNGQSPGKRVCSLQVVDTETDRVPPTMALILRNLGYGAPGFNVIYAIVEGIRVLQQPQGLRFGDVFADTGVVKVPPTERDKLLVPKKDRPSRESKAVEVPADGTAAPADPNAPAPVGAVPGDAPKPQPSISGSRPRPVAADRPSGGRPVIPSKPAAPASSAPKAPLAIDLPPEEPKSAAPAAPPVAAPSQPGIALTGDDPLKKLIDQATKK